MEQLLQVKIDKLQIKKKKGKNKTIERTLFKEFELNLSAGEIIVIIGDSGSGKSTLLNIISGFILPKNKIYLNNKETLTFIGKVTFNGKDSTYLPASERRVGLVMQRFTLYDHMSVKDNLYFPLRMRQKLSKDLMNDIVNNIISQVHLDGIDLDGKPEDLSGGQMQRIAIAKMMLNNPQIYLFDEAFSHLDFDLRQKLREQLIINPIRNKAEKKIGVIFVTHDLMDAMTADKILHLTTNERPILDKNGKNTTEKYITEAKWYPRECQKINAWQDFESINQFQVIKRISAIKPLV